MILHFSRNRMIINHALDKQLPFLGTAEACLADQCWTRSEVGNDGLSMTYGLQFPEPLD